MWDAHQAQKMKFCGMGGKNVKIFVEFCEFPNFGGGESLDTNFSNSVRMKNYILHTRIIMKSNYNGLNGDNSMCTHEAHTSQFIKKSTF